MTPVHAWSTWPAPAKLNLFLRITGRRADGYHVLQTVFRLLDWGDTVRIRVRTDAVIRRVGESLRGVAEADDLAIRAARLLQTHANVAQGADISIEKRIPSGGGFGGGSSDAATVLVVLAHLWNTGLDLDALAALGGQLGADVPVFVHGRNAWAEGIGDLLTPITLQPAAYVLVDPGVRAPTAAMFGAAQLTRDAAPLTMRAFVSGRSLGNAFEPVLRAREPAVAAALDALSRFGTARLTGSGSGCFVEFATREAAETARAALPTGLKAWTAAGVARSPLHVALEAGTGG